MFRLYYLFMLVCLLGTSAIKLFAQQDTLAENKSSYIHASLSYLSNNVYFGRGDDQVVGYLTPALFYNHKSGLFAGISTSYALSGPVKQFDLFSLEGGYAFT